LDAAIVNAEKLLRYPSIPEEERALAEDLLFGRGGCPERPFSAHFRAKKSGRQPAPARSGTVPQRLAAAVVAGSREGLVEDLDAARLSGMAPLDIIGGPLMEGMAQVGRLFAANQLIVAEVLQSAEVMRAAVDHLQRFIARSEGARRGRILLATVRGDVHDIGKNLVDIILSNNGYEVVNLGIKVPSETLVEAFRTHRPDAVGLSGLLVKSAHQMAATAQDLRDAGIDVPLLVGGAALTGRFTDTRIAPAYGGLVAYAPDAMTGLALLNRIMDGGERAKLEEESRGRRASLVSGAPQAGAGPLEAPPVRSPRVEVLPGLPPPDEEEHLLEEVDLTEVWPYLNERALYGRHLGLRGAFSLLRGAGDRRAIELERVVREVQESGWIRGRAVYRFFRAASDGNEVVIHPPGGPAASISFPRQRSGERECVSDCVRPSSLGGVDSVALFVTTAGGGVRERSEALKRDGRFLLCHALQALALETAEAAAEWLHRRIRERWGFPDPPAMTMEDRFHARYRGRRFSFGYPACPELESQETLFRLLRPERIGVSLTEGLMMDPEASVSAVVLHHPQARYFSV
jgi:5-methyltetrahydrofolate--homocysteine methyltransferase